MATWFVRFLREVGRVAVGWMRLATLSGMGFGLGVEAAEGAGAAAKGAPKILHVTPRVFEAGRASEVNIEGENLEGLDRILLSFPVAEVRVLSQSARAIRAELTPMATLKPGRGWVSVATRTGLSEPWIVILDTVGTVVRVGKGGSRDRRMAVTPPVFVEGEFSERESVWLRAPTPPHRRYVVEAIARRMNSAADPFLRRTDGAGRLLGFVEDTPGLNGDFRFELNAGREVEAYLEVRDTDFGGGRGHGFLVRIAESNWVGDTTWHLPEMAWGVETLLGRRRLVSEREPNDALDSAQIVEIGQGVEGSFGSRDDVDYYECRMLGAGEYVISARTRSVGSEAEVRLTLYGERGEVLGVNAANAANEGIVTNRLASEGRIRVGVRSLNGGWGGAHRYQLSVQRTDRISLTADVNQFVVAAGGEFEMKGAVRTNGVVGDYEVLAAGLPWETPPVAVSSTNKEPVMRFRVPAGAKVGSYHEFVLAARPVKAGEWNPVMVSTLPALRKVWGNMTWLPPEMEGRFRLWVVEGSGEASKGSATAKAP